MCWTISAWTEGSLPDRGGTRGELQVHQQPVLKCSQGIYNNPNRKFFRCPKQKNGQWDGQAVESKTADVVKLQTMDKYIPLPVFVNTFFFFENSYSTNSFMYWLWIFSLYSSSSVVATEPTLFTKMEILIIHFFF